MKKKSYTSPECTAPARPDTFAAMCTELLDSGRQVRFRAPGRSMQPTIRDGEIITVAPVSPAALKRGDIALYRFRSGVQAHRVVQVRPGKGGGRSFILRGDAPGSPDETVPADQILGKAVALQRGPARIDLGKPRSRILQAARAGTFRLERLLTRVWHKISS